MYDFHCTDLVKLTVMYWLYLEIFCAEFHPNKSKVLEIMG